MNSVLSAFLFVIGPLGAALLPLILARFGRNPRVLSKLLASWTPKKKPLPTPELGLSSSLSWTNAISGFVMLISVIGVNGLLVSLNSSPEQGLTIPIAGLAIGAVVGLFALEALSIGRQAVTSLLPTWALRESGLNAIYRDGSPLPFRNELLRSVKNTNRLDILCSDGNQFLEAISHPAHEALAAPHPSLRRATVRLVCLSPEGQRRVGGNDQTLGELALTQRGLGSEEHWRKLQITSDTVDAWRSEYGLRVQLYFVDVLPALRFATTGSRAWFHSWNDSRNWLEATDEVGRDGWINSLESALVEAYSFARDSIEVRLAAGPTKSTFIRKGVAVSEGNSQLTFVE